MHAGVDLGGKDNPIYAAADGTVTEFKKGSLGGTNTSVVIDHGGGVFTRYLHMFVDEVLVEVGDQVVAGQQIAQNGMTGSATGEHLHFEVYESGMNGGTSDPAAFYEALGLNLGSDPGGTPQPGCLTAQASTLPDSGAGSGQWSGVKGQAYALLPSFGWTDETEMVCLSELWEHESNWNATAVNSSSGACGIPQALPCSKMAKAGADYATNPVTQIRWGLDYIKGRYGSPCAAWEFWQRTDARPSPGHWY
jgi:murein DD-endopeptidase MepM/ murein hydrolase activator NlpD